MLIEAVIFARGTLVDSERLANEVLVEFATGSACRSPSRKRSKATSSAGWPIASRTWSGDWEVNCRPRSCPNCARVPPSLPQRLQAMEGAAGMLATLRVPCCVASSGPSEKISLAFASPGFCRDSKGRIFSAYEIGYWKPDPRLLLHAPGHGRAAGALRRSGQSPGIRAGLAAGMTTFDFRLRGALPASLALARLQDLPGLIASL